MSNVGSRVRWRKRLARGLGLLLVVALISVPSWRAFPEDGAQTDSEQRDRSPSSPFELELRIGGAWNLLSQPADQRGDPTLMDGAGFTGAAAIGGLALRYLWNAGSSESDAESAGGKWVAELDVLYGSHRATAFQRADNGDAERRAILHVGMLHIPVLFGYRIPGPISNNHWQIAAGPVLLHGLQSNIEIELDDATGQTRGLETTETTHVGATVQLATAVPAGPIRIPVEVRGLWNPFVGRSTLDRLQNYETPQKPGALEASFDWQLVFLTGSRF